MHVKSTNNAKCLYSEQITFIHFKQQNIMLFVGNTTMYKLYIVIIVLFYGNAIPFVKTKCIYSYTIRKWDAMSNFPFTLP